MAAGNNTYSTTGNFTWTVPAGVVAVKVQLWGGAGGGGGGNALAGGAGGGGGAFAQLNNYAVTPGANHNITVGNGGNAGGNAANGVNGTISIFRHSNNTNAAYAAPGARGTRYSNANSAGGTTAASSGNLTYAGGNGAGRNNSTAIWSGSGGGGGGNTAAGGVGVNNSVNAAGGTGGNAGGGNGGNAVLNSIGSNGVQPGGGGSGGGATNKAGGRGGVGRIIISWDSQTFTGNANVGVGVSTQQSPGIARLGSGSFTELASAYNGNHSITVPANTTLLVVTCATYESNDTNYFANGSMTFDSQTMTEGAMADALAGGYDQVGSWYLVNPSIGAKTLAWNFLNASNQNYVFLWVAYSGVDTASPVRDSDAVQTITTSVTTKTLTAQSGDLIVAATYTDAAYGTFTGVTEVVADNSGTFSHFGENLSVSGNQTVSNGGGSSTYNTIIAIVFKPLTSSGVTEIGILQKLLGVGIDIHPDVSENVLWRRSLAVGIGVGVEVAETIGGGGTTYSKTASVGLGIQPGDAEIMNLFRSLGVGVGIGISDSEKMTFPRTANVGVGVNLAQESYFGLLVDSNGNYTGSNNVGSSAGYDLWMTTGAQCPGSGNVPVTSLGVSIQGSGQVRLGIYDNSGNLVCQGSARKNIPGTEAWTEWTASELGNPTLTGGQNYKVLIEQHDVNITTGHGSSPVADTQYAARDDTAGLPATLPTTEGSWYGFPFRIGVQAVSGVTEKADFRRTANVGAGISITTTETAIFVELASVGISIAVTPLGSKEGGAQIWMKTASVSVNFHVTDSEAATFLRSLGVGIGAAITSAEKADFKRTAPVGFNIQTNALEVATFVRNLATSLNIEVDAITISLFVKYGIASVGVGVAPMTSEVANFAEQLAVGLGLNVAPSERANFVKNLVTGIGVAVTDSEKADFNRLAAIQMGMATGDQERAIFPESNSVTIIITSTTMSSVGGIKVSLVDVGVGPSVVEIANFVRSLLPNVSIQIGVSEKADFPEISTTGIGLNISASERADFTKSLAVTTNMQVVVSKIATLIRSLGPNISVQTAVAEVADFKRSIGVGVGVGVSSTALKPSGKSVFAFLNLLIATSVVIERDWAFKVLFDGFTALFDFNPDEIVFTMIKESNLEFSKPAQSFKMERKKFFELN